MHSLRCSAAVVLIGHLFVVSVSGQNVFPSSGNVGIGTTSPGKALVVNGTIGIGPEELPVQETNFGYSTSYKVLRLGLDQATRALALNVDPAAVTGGNFSGYGQILIGNRGILAPNAAGTDWMGVLRATGGKVYVGGTLDTGDLVGSGLVVSGNYVGIGTTSPSNPLDVRGIVRIGDGTNYGWIFAGSSGGLDAFHVGSFTNVPLAFFSAGSAPRMVVATSGNVGIGTTSPTHKLSVNGTIRAKEVIVDTGWADHVFAADYRLAPLSEVEQHIQHNGHLPDVPSATEVASRGVSVGEMQKILLQKIEELTLHQIEQEKRLDSQAERIRALETENSQLRTR